MMMTKKQVAVIEDLFTVAPEEPALIVSRCKKCGSLAFPRRPYCTNPDCEKKTENVEVIKVGGRGKLWSWTVQMYPPPEPFRMEPFEPFPIGMVEMENGLKVLGMLTTDRNVRIGMDLALTTRQLYEDGENVYMTWAWRPIETAGEEK